MLRELGGQGCALVGDPAYYQRFGFQNVPQLVHEGVPPEVFQVLPLKDAEEKMPKGNVMFHEGFWATKQMVCGRKAEHGTLNTQDVARNAYAGGRSEAILCRA